jgi:hypothetical protein
MNNKWLYVFLGSAIGFIVANAFFAPESMAQYGQWASGNSFKETELKPPIPSSYGNLVTVSNLKFYFQATDGTIYILEQRTPSEWNTGVTVIKRSAQK